MPNPLQPMTMPTVADQLAAYRQANALALGQATTSAPSSDNALFGQSTGMEDPKNAAQQADQKVDNASFAKDSPVNTQKMSQYDADAHMNIMRHLDQSKAYKAIVGDDKKPGPLMEILNHLHNAYASGQIDLPTAAQHLQEAGPMIDALIKKHHEADDHKNMTRHPAEYEQADSYQSVMGGQ